ncbi:MAG: hypothetical protein WKF71_11925 [Pyrinomonadaceae bacterium]
MMLPVYSSQDNFSARFSPDSRFLAYAKRLKNRAGTIYIYDTIGKKSVQITDGVAHTESPVFDANGKYLYFLSSPNSGAGEFDWGVLNGDAVAPARCPTGSRAYFGERNAFAASAE